jgi:four helix bundle protein
MTEDDLKKRTKLFALRILKLVAALPKTVAGRAIGGQLARSGTSVAANYRAAVGLVQKLSSYHASGLSKKRLTRVRSGWN